ncbi:hypothetical protein K7X08_016467 [Anisodus acutangulus]|uniref:Uncharacterized protein n=1 Tax=Anisodus acutangulus TaxID=402998 RepID=A0A9Q1R251_9SOLA|nr:hypothetical protein K7X08_016467 [Anisodus acutangulus]
MRCKKHYADASSSLGVCASCLRQRLFIVIAAEAQAQAQAQTHSYYKAIKSDTNPPPLAFPRSVSTYISRRKSDITPRQFQRNSIPDQRFYSTPQVGPNGTTINVPTLYKKKNYGLSLLSSLFRSRSKKSNLDSRVSNSGDYCPASSSSPSWFSTILPSRRKKQSRTFSLDESTIGGNRRSFHNHDRGMYPARYSNDEEEEHCFDGSSEPERTPAAQPGHNRSLSGMAFCLSPLVRTSPSRQRNKKGMPPDMVFPGEIKVPAKPHISNVASFCKNRSRKLVDFGRFNRNR